MKNNAVVSSLQVATDFHKRHDRVLRSIENLLGGLPKNGETPGKMFFKSTYRNEQNGEDYPMYFMNRDGFSLLVMGFTGKKALEWKLKYIAAFNTMEKLLLEKQSESWKEARLQGKQMRRELTDSIKDYVALAEAQGHHGSAKFAYSNITNLVKKPFGEREGANSGTLAMIATTEHILGNTLSQMVNAGADTKEAYRKLKEKAGRLSVALLEA
jgi:Rha family phage regulatory protein